MNRIRLLSILFASLTLGLLTTPAAAQSAKTLPETYVSEDESMTAHYPTGWVVQNDTSGQIIIATTEDLLDFNADSVPSGEAAVGVVYVSSVSEFSTAILGSHDPVIILNKIVKEIFTGSDTKAVLSTPKAISFADYPAARTDGTVSGNPVFLILVDNGDQNYSLVVGLSAKGELAKYEPKLLAIAESVHYVPTSQ